MEQESPKHTQQKKESIPSPEPLLKIDQNRNINLEFYSNSFQSVPHGDYIDNIHEDWKGDYELLEKHHGYIQWLFPISTGSIFNMSSRPIKKIEIQKFKYDINIAKRIVKSYQMMLEFYGMEILDLKTGKLGRASDYKSRYKNGFIDKIHNHLRITRILTFLNLVGFRKYAIEFINFLDKEIFMGNQQVKNKFLSLDHPTKEEQNKLINRISKKAPLRQVLVYNGYKYWHEMGKIDLRIKENREFILNKLQCTMNELKEESVYFQTLN